MTVADAATSSALARATRELTSDDRLEIAEEASTRSDERADATLWNIEEGFGTGTGIMGEGKTAPDVMLEMIESAEAPSADATDLAAEATEVAVSTTTATAEVTTECIAAVSRSLGKYLRFKRS